ncbi:MAG: DUF2149 domain-containing protein [Clostridia bacterium]|nr:DUF2149 domain-containing protein [Clostridia bacterium]
MEEDNPLEGGLNIVDAMLVFACGLMLALAVYWNIELVPKGERVELKRGREVTHLPEVRSNLVEARGEGKIYEKVGTVFRDPETGKLFMVTSTPGREGGEE